jgi:FkbM family methyltransferase
MELHFNRNARFTKWLLAEHRLREPFVVVDVGVRNGPHRRWLTLGDRLSLHGFDASEDAIAELKLARARHANEHYHCIAAGNKNDEAKFFFNRRNPSTSSLYQQRNDRYGNDGDWVSRTVPMRTLDTLAEEDTIPPCADFLKIDVEGFEKNVLAGARNLLAQGLLGVEVESNFNVSPEYPGSHLGTMMELLLEHGFLVFDLDFNRIPRAAFARALGNTGTWRSWRSIGRPATVDVLFCRDLIAEADAPQNYRNPCRAVTPEQIIKSLIIYELHGLNDIAVDTAERFRDRLAQHLDVDRAVGLLASTGCRGFDARVSLMAASAKWRIKAVLRALRRGVSGGG